MIYQKDCRHFNGYKPCGLSKNCSKSCPQYDGVRSKVVVVHLEALGAVLRGTCVLSAIKRKFPASHITWVTKAPAHHLLKNNPFVDRILTTSSEDLLKLKSQSFDFGFCIDKSIEAVGVIKSTSVDQVFGFDVDEQTNVIVPANEASGYLWELGLSNQKKFFENKKPETQLMIEAFELGNYVRNEYSVWLDEQELKLSLERRALWSPTGSPVIGLNTGCSGVISYKKLTVEKHRELIKSIESKFPYSPIVLLGGPEDSERNRQISKGFDKVICSPTEIGLRDGLVSTQACDLVVSGDSLGMHMAIALQKWVVAWFGPTCDHEIELYGRGVALKANVDCSPCWKRDCSKPIMCYDLVDTQQIIIGLEKGIKWLNSLSKRHSSEISY